MSRSMEGKVVVVSGASMGVGRATAQRFAQEGATVILLARRKLLLDEIADTLGANAVPIATDVTCSTEVCAAFEQVAAQLDVSTSLSTLPAPAGSGSSRRPATRTSPSP